MNFDETIPSAVTLAQAIILTEYATERIVLEIGSHYGRSTIVLASVARHVHAVDHHKGDPGAGYGDSLPMFLENIRRNDITNEKLSIHLGTCRKVLGALGTALFQVAFIDGAHDPESFTFDLGCCLDLVNPGVIICHDWNLVGETAKSIVVGWKERENMGILMDTDTVAG